VIFTDPASEEALERAEEYLNEEIESVQARK